MTLPASGTITLGEVKTEFGGPTNLLSYYRGGAYVPNATVNDTIPTSGVIRLLDFYGATKEIGNFVMTAGRYNGGSGNTAYYYTGYAPALLQSPIGTLDSNSLPHGINFLYYYSFNGSMGLGLSGFSSDPGQTGYFSLLSFDGGATGYTSASATYSYASGSATWLWIPGDVFSSAVQYTATLI